MKKMLYRSLLITSILLSGFISASSQTQPAFSGGSGTEANPFLISSKTDLDLLATTVNTNNGVYQSSSLNWSKDKHFRLTQDINEAFTNIIGDGNCFQGYFHGGGRRVHLNIKSSGNYVGMFGEISASTIDSLTVYGSVEKPPLSVPVIREDIATGGIVGAISALIPAPGKIISCVNEATVKGVVGVGGIVGHVQYPSEITFCKNMGLIHATNFAVGGIVGDMMGLVNACINTGVVMSNLKGAGGIVGALRRANSSEVSKCMNAGLIYAKTTAGGITASTTPLNYSYNINVGQVFAAEHAGSLIGYLNLPDETPRDRFLGNYCDIQISPLPPFGEGHPASSNEVQMRNTLDLIGSTIGQDIHSAGFNTQDWSFRAGVYPTPKGGLADSVALIACAPIYLHKRDSAMDVRHNFSIYNDMGVSWKSVRDKINFIENSNIAEFKELGMDSIVAQLGSYHKSILLNFLKAPCSVISEANVMACDSFVYYSVREAKELIFKTNATYQDTICTHDRTLASCDTFYTIHLTMRYSTHSAQTIDSCDRVSYKNEVYVRDTSFTERLTNAQACDSLVNTTISVRHSNRLFFNFEACEVVAYGNTNYINDTVLLDTLTNRVGCDSVTRIEIRVHHPIIQNIELDSCNKVIYQDVVYLNDTTFTEVHTFANGCDSSIFVKITVREPKMTTYTLDSCDQVSYQGTVYVSDTNLYETYELPGLCDSLVHISIIIRECEDMQIDSTHIVLLWNHTLGFANYQNLESIRLAEYKWYRGEEELSSRKAFQTFPICVPDGLYTVEVYLADGRVLSAQRRIEEVCESSIYPNPVRKDQVLKCSISNKSLLENRKIKIYDMMGREISVKINKTSSGFEISGFRFEGMYILRTEGEKSEIINTKVMVTK